MNCHARSKQNVSNLGGKKRVQARKVVKVPRQKHEKKKIPSHKWKKPIEFDKENTHFGQWGGW